MQATNVAILVTSNDPEGLHVLSRHTVIYHYILTANFRYMRPNDRRIQVIPTCQAHWRDILQLHGLRMNTAKERRDVEYGVDR